MYVYWRINMSTGFIGISMVKTMASWNNASGDSNTTIIQKEIVKDFHRYTLYTTVYV